MTVVKPGMKRVEALRLISERIELTREVAVGTTGYLDDHCEPSASAVKGVNKHGRIFITLCLRVTGKDDRHRTYDSRGVITIFQRYTDSDCITQASNSPNAPCVITSEASHKDMGDLDQLVALGEVYRKIDDVIGGTLYQKLELIEPAAAIDPDRLVAMAHETLKVAGATT